MDKGDEEVQTFSYKISHGDLMYRMVTVVNNIVLTVNLKVAKKIN